MGRTYPVIDERLRDFIDGQPVFFVATAPLSPRGHVNVSPKGVNGTFVVLGPETVAYLDLTGSGVETVAHVRENGRITLMFCAFQGPPRILRLHGWGEVLVPGEPAFDDLLSHFCQVEGTRAIIRVRVDRIADSCGYGVPLMALQDERDQIHTWARRKGPDGLDRYRREKNAVSIDGLPGLEP